jgi:hypothetical protein
LVEIEKWAVDQQQYNRPFAQSISRLVSALSTGPAAPWRAQPLPYPSPWTQGAEPAGVLPMLSNLLKHLAVIPQATPAF